MRDKFGGIWNLKGRLTYSDSRKACKIGPPYRCQSTLVGAERLRDPLNASGYVLQHLRHDGGQETQELQRTPWLDRWLFVAAAKERAATKSQSMKGGKTATQLRHQTENGQTSSCHCIVKSVHLHVTLSQYYRGSMSLR